ncbi:MAG: hypothetical protein QOH21_1349 [Acidobacteriota bacterium]|jgi:hypothetical protein|nr:hypothetical protein [Acidobacteriota bacterium]
MKKLYALLGILLIGGYAWADWTGHELQRPRRGYAPQSIRGSQSGARSFWYTGYHGGK